MNIPNILQQINRLVAAGITPTTIFINPDTHKQFCSMASDQLNMTMRITTIFGLRVKLSSDVDENKFYISMETI